MKLWKSIYLDSSSDELIEVIQAYALKRPSPMSNAVVWALMRRRNRDEELNLFLDRPALRQRVLNAVDDALVRAHVDHDLAQV